MTVNNKRPRASHGTGKMCKTNMCPFHRVYKTSSREFKRQGQSIIHLHYKDVNLKRALRYLWCWLYLTVVQLKKLILTYTRFRSSRDIFARVGTGARRLDSFFFFFFFFFAFSPVWRPLRYVHATILPLKPFLSILNQPSSMGYYTDKVGNAVS